MAANASAASADHCASARQRKYQRTQLSRCARSGHCATLGATASSSPNFERQSSSSSTTRRISRDVERKRSSGSGSIIDRTSRRSVSGRLSSVSGALSARLACDSEKTSAPAAVRVVVSPSVTGGFTVSYGSYGRNGGGYAPHGGWRAPACRPADRHCSAGTSCVTTMPWTKMTSASRLMGSTTSSGALGR